jgi:DNA polymerase III subunit beta
MQRGTGRMKIRLQKSALFEGLQAVQNVVSLRSTVPILFNVLLKAEKDRLYLTTTDLDLSVRCTVEAEVAKSGTGTLPAKKFSGIVRELTDGVVDIELDDKGAGVVKKDNAFFRIVGLAADEFPPLPKVDGKYSFHLDQGLFKEMLRKTSYAVSNDETRFVLNGVLLSFKGGKLTVVATDGRRMALAENEVEFPKEAEMDIIIPPKAVYQLQQTLGDSGEMKIHVKDNMAIFEYGNVFMASKLIEGTYPNYRQVIPSQCEERITVEREQLLSAIRRVSLLTADKQIPAKMTFAKNNLVVSTSAPDVGEAKVTLAIKYTGKEKTVAFNPDFIPADLHSR